MGCNQSVREDIRVGTEDRDLEAGITGECCSPPCSLFHWLMIIWFSSIIQPRAKCLGIRSHIWLAYAKSVRNQENVPILMVTAILMEAILQLRFHILRKLNIKLTKWISTNSWLNIAYNAKLAIWVNTRYLVFSKKFYFLIHKVIEEVNLYAVHAFYSLALLGGPPPARKQITLRGLVLVMNAWT